MNTQTKQILKHLESGKSITPLEALSRYGCMRLGARIYELRRAGAAVYSEMVKRGKKRVARYSLYSGVA